MSMVLSSIQAWAFERTTFVAIWPLIAWTVPPPLNDPPDAVTVLVASAAICASSVARTSTLSP